MELNFDKLFKISLTAMKINRSGPHIKRDLKWLAQFLLLHGQYTVLFCIIVYNIIYINIKQKDFSETCKNGALAVVYITVTGQYGIMLWKQQQLKTLMNHMKNDYILANSLPAREQNIILDYALKGMHVCKQWLYLSIVATALFPLKNVVIISWYWIDKEELILVPIYDLVYPAFIEDRKDSIFVYSITYIAMLWYGCYSGVMYCTFVPLGSIFLLHACGQLEVVKCRIERIFESDDLEEVKQKLNDNVKQLQCIYNFVDRIKLTFTVAYEMTLKITTIVLPITCYEVIESLKRGNLSLEFITLIIGGVLLSSSPCFYGDLLMEKGEDVRLAIYSCGWEKVYDLRIRSTVKIILQRALRPVAIRTLFSALCLDTLTGLFQQSYTLYNLMNAAWN